MKKSLIAVLVAAVLVASLGVVSSVYAYGGNPGNGNGTAVQLQLQTEDGLGLYHDEILAAFSEALDIPVEDLEARIEAGETIIEIAIAEGMSLEDAQALLPVGNFAGRSAGWMGLGFMATGEKLNSLLVGNTLVTAPAWSMEKLSHNISNKAWLTDETGKKIIE